MGLATTLTLVAKAVAILHNGMPIKAYMLTSSVRLKTPTNIYLQEQKTFICQFITLAEISPTNREKHTHTHHQ
jgi:hypothetical protein